ncbi:MAG: hypothetical protein OXC80_10295 [Gammaproteobacteria bacterium]|nr:hypothetical protein [Gammaproteobacteria bacterium]
MSNCSGRLPDCSDRPLRRHDVGDAQRPGPQGCRHHARQSLDGWMSSPAEALACAKIELLLKDADWYLTDYSNVLFEYELADGTSADYVLCDRQSR